MMPFALKRRKYKGATIDKKYWESLVGKYINGADAEPYVGKANEPIDSRQHITWENIGVLPELIKCL